MRYITEDYGFVITKSRLQITKITKDYTGITGQAYEITATLQTPRVLIGYQTIGRESVIQQFPEHRQAKI